MINFRKVARRFLTSLKDAQVNDRFVRLVKASSAPVQALAVVEVTLFGWTAWHDGLKPDALLQNITDPIYLAVASSIAANYNAEKVEAVLLDVLSDIFSAVTLGWAFIFMGDTFLSSETGLQNGSPQAIYDYGIAMVAFIAGMYFLVGPTWRRR